MILNNLSAFRPRLQNFIKLSFQCVTHVIVCIKQGDLEIKKIMCVHYLLNTNAYTNIQMCSCMNLWTHYTRTSVHTCARNLINNVLRIHLCTHSGILTHSHAQIYSYSYIINDAIVFSCSKILFKGRFK